MTKTTNPRVLLQSNMPLTASQTFGYISNRWRWWCRYPPRRMTNKIARWIAINRLSQPHHRPCIAHSLVDMMVLVGDVVWITTHQIHHQSPIWAESGRRRETVAVHSFAQTKFLPFWFVHCSSSSTTAPLKIRCLAPPPKNTSPARSSTRSMSMYRYAKCGTGCFTLFFFLCPIQWNWSTNWRLSNAANTSFSPQFFYAIRKL